MGLPRSAADSARQATYGQYLTFAVVNWRHHTGHSVARRSGITRAEMWNRVLRRSSHRLSRDNKVGSYLIPIGHKLICSDTSKMRARGKLF